jgi:hypothetical protein
VPFDSPTPPGVSSVANLGGEIVLKLLERNIATIERRLVLLAPPRVGIPEAFTNVTIDPHLHRQLVREMQAVRGAIYLNEGNVKHEELTAEGLHRTAEDEQSWHLLWTDSSGQVSSCAWYLEHENSTSMERLRLRHCPLATADEWSDKLRGAIEREIARARNAGLRYAEVGGWAVSKARRCTSEGLVLALAAYGLCKMLGGALGVTTANVTHSSSAILRRLGGSYLEFNGTPMPAYFDPKYNTNIELLRFDSRRPSTKYHGLIEMLKSRLAHVPVVGAFNEVHAYDAIRVTSVAEPLFAA